MTSGKPRKREIADDPIGAAEDLAADISGSRKKLYAQLAEAYEIACLIGEDDDLLQTFRAHAFWNESKAPPHPLRAVMRFVFRAKTTDGPAYERACNYTVALESEWIANVPASHIVQVIEAAGGIEELYSVGKARRAAAKKTVNTDIFTEETNSKSGEGDRQGEDRIEPGEQSSAQPGEHKNRKPIRKYSREWCEERFVSEIPDEALLKSLLRLPVRGSMTVKITCMGKDEDGFKLYTTDRNEVAK